MKRLTPVNVAAFFGFSWNWGLQNAVFSKSYVPYQFDKTISELPNAEPVEL
jgi:hypothetical protein